MVNYLQTVQSFMWSVHYRVGQFQTFLQISCICMLFAVPLGTIGEMQFFLILVNQFFEQNASFLWAKEQKSNSLMKKSEGHSFVMSDGSNLLLGIEKGKTVKNCQKVSKTYKKYNFFERIARFLWAKEQFACEKDQITHFGL